MLNGVSGQYQSRGRRTYRTSTYHARTLALTHIHSSTFITNPCTHIQLQNLFPPYSPSRVYSDQWISFTDWLLPDTTESKANGPDITESSGQRAGGLPAINSGNAQVVHLVTFPWVCSKGRLAVAQIFFYHVVHSPCSLIHFFKWIFVLRL